MNETPLPTTTSPTSAKKLRLPWSEPSRANEKCRYDHTFVDTAFGRLLLTWKSWKDDPSYGFDEVPWGDFGTVEYRDWNSVEEAQLWAEEELERRLLEALRPLQDGQPAS